MEGVQLLVGRMRGNADSRGFEVLSLFLGQACTRQATMHIEWVSVFELHNEKSLALGAQCRRTSEKFHDE